MKVFTNHVISRIQERRNRILEILNSGSQNVTQIYRFFKGSISKAILKHDLKNFQKMGIVKSMKLQGVERIYFTNLK